MTFIMSIKEQSPAYQPFFVIFQPLSPIVVVICIPTFTELTCTTLNLIEYRGSFI